MAYKRQPLLQPLRPRKATAPRPPLPKPPNDLDALEKSVNDASGRAGGLWLSFITFATLLLITTGSVTHKKLFLEEPVRLPVLNADLPLIGYFFAAPIFFLVFHFYLLLQLQGLSAKMRVYADQLFTQHPDAANRRLLRHRIDGFIFAQILVGTRERRGGAIGWLNRLVASITVVLLPIVTLLQFQVAFLPYHGEAITWWHRILLIVDLALIWFFWKRLMPPRTNLLARKVAEAVSDGYARFLFARQDATEDVRSLIMNIVGPVVLKGAWLASRLPPALVVIFSVLVAAYPTEWIYGASLRQPFAGLTAALFQQGDVFDPETGATTFAEQRSNWGLSNRMLLSDADLDIGARLKKIRDEEGAAVAAENERMTLRLVARDFAYARLERVDLRKVNLDAADLRGALLRRANLQLSRLSCDVTLAESGASPPPTTPKGTEKACARLYGVDLFKARLQGATLKYADLTGAYLKSAGLEGSDLSFAILHGANLMDAKLQASNLSGAELHAANLTRARLQGAQLTNSILSGADLSKSQLQGAVLREAVMNGADLTGAYIYRTSCSGSGHFTRGEGCNLAARGSLRRVVNTSRIEAVGEGQGSFAGDFSFYTKDIVLRVAGERSALDVRRKLAIFNDWYLKVKADVRIGLERDRRAWLSERNSFRFEAMRGTELARLACNRYGAPNIARGLLNNDAFQKVKAKELEQIATTMLSAKGNTKACPGTKGFMENDWLRLQKLKASALEDSQLRLPTPSTAP